MSWDIDAFVEKLENNHTFPGPYTFKFIVTLEHQAEVEELVKNAEIRLKPSSGNKYVSVTIKANMENSMEVVEIYKKAKNIEGIISL